MQLSEAREQAAYQAKSDALSVEVAERNLSNTIKEQKLQWASMMSTQNSAANEFKKYMALLSPAGRQLVTQVLGMKGAYDKLKTSAQNAVVPGLLTFVQGLATLMPTVQHGVTEMGTAISGAFSKMGKAMETSGAKKTLNGLFTNGMQFVNTVLPALGGMFGAIANLGSQKGAVSGLSDLIKGVADGIGGFAKGIKPYIPDLNQLFGALGKIAKAAGPALAKDIGTFAVTR